MGLFSSIGKIFNDITWVTHSAKLNNQYQKEFAQNAHQWEVEDLKKAGLNPAITAGGSGAAASGGGSVGSANTDITGVMNSAVGAVATLKQLYNQTKETESNTANTNADTITKILNNKNLEKYLDKKTLAEIDNLTANTVNLMKNSAKTSVETKKLKQGKFADVLGVDAGSAKGIKTGLGNLLKMFEGK